MCSLTANHAWENIKSLLDLVKDFSESDTVLAALAVDKALNKYSGKPIIEYLYDRCGGKFSVHKLTKQLKLFYAQDTWFYRGVLAGLVLSSQHTIVFDQTLIKQLSTVGGIYGGDFMDMLGINHHINSVLGGYIVPQIDGKCYRHTCTLSFSGKIGYATLTGIKSNLYPTGTDSIKLVGAYLKHMLPTFEPSKDQLNNVCISLARIETTKIVY